MAEIVLNRPNWLGSEVGLVRKTVTVTSASGSPVTENGRKILKSGTLIEDTNIGKGLLWNDADVTEDGGKIASIMIRGTYIDANLPTTLAASAEELAQQGLYSIKYGATKITYGEVTE